MQFAINEQIRMMAPV